MEAVKWGAGMRIDRKERRMATFSIHRSEHTGEAWVIEFDGTSVVRRHGPIPDGELRRLTPDTLHLVEFDDESIDEVWGIPLAYRDGEWVTESP